MPNRAEGETRADVARRYDEEHGLTDVDFDDEWADDSEDGRE